MSRLRLVLIVLVLLLLSIAGCALAGGSKPVKGLWRTTTSATTSTATVTTVQTVTVQVPGPPGPGGQVGATGPQGLPGSAAIGTDLCPNWDGIQTKPPKGTVGTLNPRGQFVCVAFWRAKAWHPLK